jgi:hypothetical protein
MVAGRSSFSARLARRLKTYLNAVPYARDVIAGIPFARPGHEALKNEIILPTLNRALNKALRGFPT